MSTDTDQKLESGSAAHLIDMIEAVDRRIHDYLLRQHLSAWHPISTAPDNQDLELTVLDGAASVVLPFPCRRTNAGEWINADLQTSITIQPTTWRPWQKAKACKPRPDAAGPPHRHHEQRWSDT